MPPLTDRAPGSRSLGHHHFAFLRGWVQGLPLSELADRYLESGLDLRLAKSQLGWLRSEMVALAARSPRPELAAVLRRSPIDHAKSLPTAAPPLPSLEEFANRFPEGFYSENELALLFAEAYAVQLSPAERRRTRLVERQLAALHYLEPLSAVPPRPADGVNAWFLEVVAARLANAGLTTLQHLQDLYRVRGARWWVEVPGLGAKGAARICKWWAQHNATLGPLTQARRDDLVIPRVASAAYGPAPSSTPSYVIAPLEHFAVPREFSGECGGNRQTADRCKLAASNDHEAILAWLSTRPTGSATWRSYRREAERFLLWVIIERGKPFSSATTEDCIAYRDFLGDPQPAWRWVGRGALPRWSSEWRPFVGPLGASSTQHAQTVLRLLCEWLARQRYLDANPWDGVPVIAPNRVRLRVGRSFTQSQWMIVTRRLAALPPSPASARMQFLIPFLYATGLRLSEIASARARQLEHSAEASSWLLHILGKGLIAREVPLASDTVALLLNYLAQAYPDAWVDIDPSLEAMVERMDPELPLLRRIETRRDEHQTLSSSAVYKSVKSFFADVARRTDLISEKERKRFAEASTHWLRHTFASHAVADGAPLDVIRDVMGHASISTTSIYVSVESKRRASHLEALAKIRSERSPTI